MHLKPQIARILKLHEVRSGKYANHCSCGWQSMVRDPQDHQADQVIEVIKAHLGSMIVHQ